MKKICLLMAILFLVGAVLGACAKKSGKGDGADSTGKAVGTESKDPYLDDVPKDLTYPGYEFVMAFPAPDNKGLECQLLEDGEAVSKLETSIYNRNLQIEERFDITLDGIVAGDIASQTQNLESLILSGDDVVDLAFIGFTFSGIPWISSGNAMPWNDVDYIDPSRTYWNQSVVDNLSLNGNIFLIQGNINWPAMKYTQLCFFSTNMAKDNKVENLYDAVEAGTWTFEKMKSIASSVSKDLNGDGVRDENDQYGLLFPYFGATYEIGIAADYITAPNTENGFKLNVETDKFISIAEYAIDLIYDDKTTYYERNDTLDTLNAIFYEDRGLFFTTSAGVSDFFRDKVTDYGVIPFPKWDEKQAQYRTTSDQWGLSCSIPVTATDPSRTGAITEALCALTGKTVYPTYYEEVLSARNTRDEESKKMLDLIFSNIVYDPGIIYGTSEAYIVLYSLIDSKSANVSRWASRYSETIQEQFDELFDYVEKNYS